MIQDYSEVVYYVHIILKNTDPDRMLTNSEPTTYSG